jgi:hypothetical protein
VAGSLLFGRVFMFEEDGAAADQYDLPGRAATAFEYLKRQPERS